MGARITTGCWLSTRKVYYPRVKGHFNIRLCPGGGHGDREGQLRGVTGPMLEAVSLIKIKVTCGHFDGYGTHTLQQGAKR